MSKLSIPNDIVDGALIEASEHQQNYKQIESFVNGEVIHADGSVAMDAGAELLLGKAASVALGAVTKAQLDGFLPLSGGTVTGDLEVHSQNRSVRIFDSGVNNYAELGFTSQGSNGPANGYLSGNAVVIRTGGSRETMQDVFVALSDGNVKAYGDLQVDGTINAAAGKGLIFGGNWQTARIYNTDSAGREFMVIGDGTSGTQIQLHGNNDSTRPGKVNITGQLLVNGSPLGLFSIADDIDTADVLTRAETATMPVVDDEGVATADADVEGITVNEVVTALLAKVKELSARIEMLEGQKGL